MTNSFAVDMGGAAYRWLTDSDLFGDRYGGLAKLLNRGVIQKDLAALDASGDDVMQGTGSIDAGLPGHGGYIPWPGLECIIVWASLNHLNPNFAEVAFVEQGA